jgi:hypothetical protein
LVTGRLRLRCEQFLQTEISCANDPLASLRNGGVVQHRDGGLLQRAKLMKARDRVGPRAVRTERDIVQAHALNAHQGLGKPATFEPSQLDREHD